MQRPTSPFQAVVFDYGNVLTMVDRLAQCRQLGRHSPLAREEFLEDFAVGFELNPEGVAALRLAAGAGKRTFILSNTSFPHARRLFLHEELTTIPEGYVDPAGGHWPEPVPGEPLLRAGQGKPAMAGVKAGVPG